MADPRSRMRVVAAVGNSARPFVRTALANELGVVVTP
jgi:hypothetical protein